MNLVESIFRGGFALRADATGTPARWDNFWYEPLGAGQASSAGMKVSAETSKRLAIVIACVSYRGKMRAIQPTKIRKDLPGGGSKLLPKHPWYRTLALRPNPVQTAYDFIYMMNGHVDLRGNAFAEKRMTKDGPELWPLHPDRVRVEVIEATGALKYLYDNPLTKKTDTFAQEEIFHLRDWCDGMWVGQSRISMALDPLGLALARQDYQARFMRNDTRTGFAIVGTNFKTDEDQEKFRKKIQETQAGANRGKALILPAGLDVKSMGVTPVDAQLIEGKKVSDTEICSIFGVLPHAVGVDAGKAATFASTEQFNIMNAQQCMHPMNVMWEQAIQRDLLGYDDEAYAKISMAALLRGDNATRFQGYAVAIQNSWMCPDDVRELEDLNPIPDGAGKVFWRSANLLPLKQLTAPSQGGGNDEGGNADDAGDDGSGGDANAKAGSLPDPAMKARLQMLATGTADRCVRREKSAVTRMIDRRAGFAEIEEFYAEHARFITDAFHLEVEAALKVKMECTARGQQLAAHLADEDDEFAAAAQVWLEQVAATEATKLAALAVEGVR